MFTPEEATVTMLGMAKHKRSGQNVPPNPPPRRPNRTGKPLYVYIAPALRDAIDTAVDQTVPRASITAHVEVALQQYLTKIGLWPPAH